MHGISFGSDPEFMLHDREGNLVSAIGRVKGTKDKKIDLGRDNYLFYDNVLAEMNVKPGEDEDSAIDNIRTCLTLVARVVKPAMLIQQASATYPKTECVHPDAKVFGCEPEYCAYDLKQIQAPDCTNTFRSAGGHIHLGDKMPRFPLMAPVAAEGTVPDGEEAVQRDWGRVWVVRMMDLFVGLPSVLLDNDPSTAPRRKLYGKAGSHRPKMEYGVEYRATGNFWLSSPRMATLIYRLSMFTVDFVAEHRHEKMWEGVCKKAKCKAYKVGDLRNAIDKTDRVLAAKLMEEVVKPVMPEHLWMQIFALSKEPYPTNLYREWGISL